jgi:cell division protein ZapB
VPEFPAAATLTCQSITEFPAPVLKRHRRVRHLLTALHVAHYSGGMNSEFDLLSEKINGLAELAHALRRENAELRLKVSEMTVENAELSRRMLEAYQRVTALLEKLPLSEHDEEAA